MGCLAVCWGSRVWPKDTSDLCIIKQEIGFSMHLAGQHLFRICAGSPQLSDWEAFHQMPKQALTHATLGPAQRPWAQPSPPASWSQVQGAVDRASGHTGTTHPAGCQSAPGPECGWWSWAERRMSPGEAGEWTPRSPNMKREGADSVGTGGPPSSRDPQITHLLFSPDREQQTLGARLQAGLWPVGSTPGESPLLAGNFLLHRTHSDPTAFQGGASPFPPTCRPSLPPLPT